MCGLGEIRDDALGRPVVRRANEKKEILRGQLLRMLRIAENAIHGLVAADSRVNGGQTGGRIPCMLLLSLVLPAYLLAGLRGVRSGTDFVGPPRIQQDLPVGRWI